MSEELTKKEKYLIKTFKVDEEIVRKISEIGRLIGTHKFDVWIAKEVKKDNSLLNNLEGFLFVIDWAQKKKPNISSLSFEQAYAQSIAWHNSLEFNKDAKNKESEDDNKILYRCRDGEHYFILLSPEELELEGQVMKSCVGSYESKVSAGKSLIISLRDKNNNSHVTIEIDVQTGMAIQTKGKANTEPSNFYLSLITQFALFCSGYEVSMDKELLELMNMQFD